MNKVLLSALALIGLFLIGCQKGVEKESIKGNVPAPAQQNAPSAHGQADGHDHDAHNQEHPQAAAPAPSAEVDRENVMTVESIYAKKADLNGKKVSAKGKVVKFNAGIMGKNWIHLQDGTGAQGTNDLTITTDQTVAVETNVVITGTAAVDKDFGAGYKYAIIVENAAVAAE